MERALGEVFRNTPSNFYGVIDPLSLPRDRVGKIERNDFARVAVFDLNYCVGAGLDVGVETAVDGTHYAAAAAIIGVLSKYLNTPGNEHHKLFTKRLTLSISARLERSSTPSFDVTTANLSPRTSIEY